MEISTLYLFVFGNLSMKSRVYAPERRFIYFKKKSWNISWVTNVKEVIVEHIEGGSDSP